MSTFDLHMNSTGVLQSQVRQLTIVNQSLTENIELLKSIGDFYADQFSHTNLAPVFKEGHLRLRNIIPFHAIGFMLVRKTDGEFIIVDCEPSSDFLSIQAEIDAQINTGTFAWAMQQTKATIALTMQADKTIVFHPLIWDGYTIGMFVGIVESSEIKILDASLNLLSVICTLISAVVKSADIGDTVTSEINSSPKAQQDK
jgi:hypothetical protein